MWEIDQKDKNYIEIYSQTLVKIGNVGGCFISAIGNHP